MKEYEKWTANIENKIDARLLQIEKRRTVIKRCAAALTCVAVLVCSAFAIPYFLKDDVSVPPSVDTQQTGDGTTSDTTSDREQQPSDTSKWVSYKTETGEYSWFESKGGAGIGGSLSSQCPEGHSYAYHEFTGNLIRCVTEGNWHEGNVLDKTYKAWAYPKIYRTIEGKCNGCTLRSFIEEFDISREELEEKVDLVELYNLNLEVLYGDADECDRFYKYTEIFERRREMYYNYYAVMRGIIERYRENLEDRLPFYGGEDAGRRWENTSIPELAYYYELSREELENVIDEIMAERDSELTFNYDFSVIYNEDGSFREELEGLDMTKNDFESAVKLAVKLGEDFCRIREWEDPEEIGDEINEGEGLGVNSYYACGGQCIDDGFTYKCYDLLKDEDGKYPALLFEEMRESPFALKSIIDDYGLTLDELLSVAGEYNWSDDGKVLYVPDDVGYCILPIEILFNGTMDDVLAFYGDVSHRVSHYKELTFNRLSWYLYNFYTDEDGHSLRAKGPLSVPDLAQMANVSREELEALIKWVEGFERPSQEYYGGGFYQYDYDIDMIYNEDGSFKELPKVEVDTHESIYERREILDRMFCGVE